REEGGSPSYADLQRLRELTVPQLTGLNLLAQRGSPLESTFIAAPLAMAVFAAGSRKPSGPLPVGEYESIHDGRVEQQVSIFQPRLTPAQRPLMAQLLALEPVPEPPPLFEGEL